ncbi:unnamed protein product, partial [Medioppia subpectinata]
MTVIVNAVEINLNLCDDWVAYNKEKCFKVIPKRMDKTLAQSECTKLDPKASLMIITSSDEQEFVNKMLTNYSQYTDKVWTGMTNVKTADVYNNWVDGIPYEYTTQITMTRNYNNNYQDTIKM